MKKETVSVLVFSAFLSLIQTTEGGGGDACLVVVSNFCCCSLTYNPHYRVLYLTGLRVLLHFQPSVCFFHLRFFWSALNARIEFETTGIKLALTPEWQNGDVNKQDLGELVAFSFRNFCVDWSGNGRNILPGKINAKCIKN